MTIDRQPETVQYKCLYNISVMKPKKGATKQFLN